MSSVCLERGHYYRKVCACLREKEGVGEKERDFITLSFPGRPKLFSGFSLAAPGDGDPEACRRRTLT